MTGTCLVCSLSRNLLSLPQKYHHGAARSAQKWAEQCRLLTHDTAKGRWVDNYGACGQNIFVSTQKVPWWERERDDPFLPKSSISDAVYLLFAGFSRWGCGLQRDRISPTDPRTMNWAWSDITPKWCGRPLTRWDADWPGVPGEVLAISRITITCAIIVQCEYLNQVVEKKHPTERLQFQVGDGDKLSASSSLLSSQLLIQCVNKSS